MCLASKRLATIVDQPQDMLGVLLCRLAFTAIVQHKCNQQMVLGLQKVKVLIGQIDYFKSVAFTECSFLTWINKKVQG